MYSATKEVFYEDYLRATDSEIQAALEEDGVASTISVDQYRRAVPLFRSRQKHKAAKEAAARANQRRLSADEVGGGGGPPV